MIRVMETQPISRLREHQAEILEIAERQPVLLTHHGSAAGVLVSPEQWNKLADLLEKYQDTEIIQQRLAEMDNPEFYHTVEEAEEEFRKVGLLA